MHYQSLQFKLVHQKDVRLVREALPPEGTEAQKPSRIGDPELTPRFQLSSALSGRERIPGSKRSLLYYCIHNSYGDKAGDD